MSVGIAIICKTPKAGQSKTRLSPPLSLDQCARLSDCFIRDLSANIHAFCEREGHACYAIYTPRGTEGTLRDLLPESFELILQRDGDLGQRLLQGVEAILERGHRAAIIVNADSPTLPTSVLKIAAARLLAEDCVVLGPAIDGGYTLVGLSRPHRRIFEDIPWSSEAVHRLTRTRAAEIGLPAYDTPPWYDVDDAESLGILLAELRGSFPAFAQCAHVPAPARATRAYLDDLFPAELDSAP